MYWLTFRAGGHLPTYYRYFGGVRKVGQYQACTTLTGTHLSVFGDNVLVCCLLLFLVMLLDRICKELPVSATAS